MAVAATVEIQHTGPQIGDKPYQPRITFPKVSFGQTSVKRRSFQATWFDKWQWLHWDSSSERAFCHVCVQAAQARKLTAKCAENTFISQGFQNWKDATRMFAKHENSSCHLEAVEKVITLPATTRHIGELLSNQVAEDRKRNRASLLQILRAMRYLARQGLAIRGSSASHEADGNFSQLLRVFCEFDDGLASWLRRKADKYTSADMQNELVQVMAICILRGIASCIQGRVFTVMVDETTDVSTQEQCVVVLRWVDDLLEVHEDFIGLHSTPSADANSIVAIIKDVLVRLNLSLRDCRGQCYDGAAVMRGCRNGVATQLQKDEPRAVFVHCYGHSLNLACQDTVRDIKQLQSVLDTVFELSKLLKYSAKRNAEYKRLQAEMAPEDPGFRTLCPTRWTVRAASLQSVRKNYTVLQRSLENFADLAKREPEMSARCSGVAAQFQTFDFFFGVFLGEKLLSLADNLSRALQKKNMSAAEGQAMATLTIKSLRSLRNDKEFHAFWENILANLNDVDVAEPTLPRRRKIPARYDTSGGSNTAYYPASVEDHYRVIYFSALDSIIQCILDRFEQPGYQIYCKLEAILLKGSSGSPYDDELATVIEFYAGDFEELLLRSQLLLLKTHFQGTSDSAPSLKDIVEFVKKHQQSFTEVVKMLILILVLPATNATSERSFSALRLVKTYLRSTMGQARLNHLLILHIHKDACDDLSLEQCAAEFCFDSEHRRNIFGTFNSSLS